MCGLWLPHLDNGHDNSYHSGMLGGLTKIRRQNAQSRAWPTARINTGWLKLSLAGRHVNAASKFLSDQVSHLCWDHTVEGRACP